MICQSLTDDQKVMEQCRYSGDFYQEIGSSDSHLYSSLTDTNTDDYESIEDIKRDNELEWRVLSRLEGEMGEDWRIVNSMPRTRTRNTGMVQKMSENAECELKDKMRDGEREEEIREKNIVISPGEQAVNGKNFRENLWSKRGKDLYEGPGPLVTGSDRQKQVTFGKLLVFPC